MGHKVTGQGVKRLTRKNRAKRWREGKRDEKERKAITDLHKQKSLI